MHSPRNTRKTQKYSVGEGSPLLHFTVRTRSSRPILNVGEACPPFGNRRTEESQSFNIYQNIEILHSVQNDRKKQGFPVLRFTTPIAFGQGNPVPTKDIKGIQT